MLSTVLSLRVLRVCLPDGYYVGGAEKAKCVSNHADAIAGRRDYYLLEIKRPNTSYAISSFPRFESPLMFC